MKDIAKYGYYDTIDREYLLAGIKGLLMMRETSDDDIFLIDLINRGVKRLQNNSIYLPAVAQLPITNFQAKLPDGFVTFTKPQPIVFVNGDGTIADTFFNAPNFTNNTFFEFSPFPTDVLINYGGSATIVDGVIIFSSDVSATYCKISYISTNIDLNGDVKIPALAEDTLTEFVLWMYKRSNTDRYTPYEIQDHKVLWQRGKKGLKGLFNLPDSFEMQFISSKINSIL